MTGPPRAKLVPLLFGDVPVNAINAALGLELDEGHAVMSPNALRHAQRRHSADFARCLPHVAAVVTNPLYVRDDFANHGKIELVGHPPALGDYLLVATAGTMWSPSTRSRGRRSPTAATPGTFAVWC